MPELPEVETVVQGLIPICEGATIKNVKLHRANLRFPFAEHFADHLTGQVVSKVRRRAKYILMDLVSDDLLICHLGMTGSFRWIDHQKNASHDIQHLKHDHVTFTLSHVDTMSLVNTMSHADDHRYTLIYSDPRRFGYMDYLNSEEKDVSAYFKDLGPEPFGNDFHEAYLAEKALTSKSPLKAFLLNQKTVAGLGNIYVCEALFRSHLDPTRIANTLSSQEISLLYQAIRSVLQDAIRSGGSSLKDFIHVDGSLGYFQHAFQVYGRKGEACLKEECGGEITSITQSGRTTFYCPACQK